MLQFRETVFNEVFDSQIIFRILLDTMSRPGKITELPDIQWQHLPQGLNPGIFSVLKTLADQETSVYIDSSLIRPDMESYLIQNLRISVHPSADADYAIYQGQTFNRDFNLSDTGTIEFPEISTTILLGAGCISSQPEMLNYSNQLYYEASGPGIREVNRFFINGIDPEYIRAFLHLNRYYPCGVNMILIDENRRTLCLPRTVKLEEKKWVM